MRTAAIAFAGIVAGLASCSSYGESVSDPGVGDGGASSSGATGGADAALADGGSSPVDSGAEAGALSAPTPTIVQVASSSPVSTGPDQLTLVFDKTIGSGHTVVLFVASWGPNMRQATLDTVVFSPIASAGQLPVHTALMAVAPGALRTSRIQVSFESPGGNYAAMAIELANAGSHTQSTSNGMGDVLVDQLATAPNADLVIANVAGNGPAPVGPLDAEPLGQPIDDHGRVMVAGSTVATATTSPRIGWKANGAFQWDAIVLALKPAP